ncbi:glycerophosphodiester phosphodiesterase [Nocardia sp. NBC_01503]|uniref:glycerophosphodiester phosphodiesterase n=1 Tax=Nocardia sp. NBC_01503 TaxID=2975997 RepID=UPI002E7ABF8F|nr:glycerophosphodiester phosphodiesterase [Nocardia sp. NBC_01503]WTL35942.1 glycerophosphodiester phosphodiesterase [Nocardia sp. NBC_01503]
MTFGNVKSSQLKRAFAVFGVAVAAAGLTACAGSDDSGSTSANSGTHADPQRVFDLQAHRGGRGMTIEESLPGFAKAIELGVGTLELDIVLTEDKVPLVWHDPKILPEKCSDTAPAFIDDPQYPYVGKLVHDLTSAQIDTLDCGSKLAGFPEAQELPGNRIARLPEVFDLVRSYPGAFDALRYNIETKLEAEHPEQSATPAEFVDVILGAISTAGATSKVEIQSFDWRSLPLVKAENPAIPTVALYDDTTFKPDSMWLSPIRYADHPDDPLAAIKALGADISSPAYVNPWDSEAKVGDPNFTLTTTEAYVARAHALGLKVIPWTVNDKQTIALVLDQGVDGLITDYPNRAREAMKEKGYLPPPSFHK